MRLARPSNKTIRRSCSRGALSPRSRGLPGWLILLGISAGLVPETDYMARTVWQLCQRLLTVNAERQLMYELKGRQGKGADSAGHGEVMSCWNCGLPRSGVNTGSEAALLRRFGIS